MTPSPPFLEEVKHYLGLSGVRDYEAEADTLAEMKAEIVILAAGKSSLVLAKQRPAPDTAGPPRPRFIIWDALGEREEETYTDFSAFLVALLRKVGQ